MAASNRPADSGANRRHQGAMSVPPGNVSSSLPSRSSPIRGQTTASFSYCTHNECPVECWKEIRDDARPLTQAVLVRIRVLLAGIL